MAKTGKDTPQYLETPSHYEEEFLHRERQFAKARQKWREKMAKEEAEQDPKKT
ncbi:hypothetical protein [Roseobacter sp. HKCCA0434]|uniref:hypothetical protein n=1 Tax=Roseobacter sp. HKCCA0434 TaxID=3079297 RepID=UPI0029059772|nr:hypothetical protein [Roseobacter sp. HKCCA0434]